MNTQIKKQNSVAAFKKAVVGLLLILAAVLGCLAFEVGKCQRSVSADSGIYCEIGLSVAGVEVNATLVTVSLPPEMTVVYEFRLSGEFNVGDVCEQVVLKLLIPHGVGTVSVTLAPSFIVGAGSGGFSNSDYTGQELSFIMGETYTLEEWSFANIDGIGSSSSKAADSSVVFSRVYEFPPDPVMEHHDFVGWYLDEGLTQPYDGRLIYEDTQLYAKFVLKTYHIYFETGYPDVSVSSATRTALTSVGSLSDPPQKTGYDFDGWFVDFMRTVPYDPEAAMTGDVTLYAKLSAIVYTVTFYVGDAVYTTVDIPYGCSFAEAVSQAGMQMSAVRFVSFEGGLGASDDMSGGLFVIGNTSVFGDDLTAGQKIGLFFADYWRLILGAVLLVALAVCFVPKGKKRKAGV